MKVLMFGWEFPPHITGGLGTACFGMTKALAEKNTEVIFVVPKAHGDENTQSVDLISADRVEIDFRNPIYADYEHLISYVQINSTLVPYCGVEDFYQILRHTEASVSKIGETGYKRTYPFSGSYGKDLLEEVHRYAFVARSVANEKSFDVIHAHDWLTYEAGVEARKISGKPLVIHVHATEFDRSGENVNQAVYDMERYGMEQADKIIAVSDYTKKIVIERYGQPENKVHTVYNGIDISQRKTDKPKANRRVKQVCFVGRITFQKGPDYFISAAEKIIRKDPSVHFVMAGSGDMLNKMISLVASKRISKNFHFAGFLNKEEVSRLFHMSDLFVMPSVSEPFGIVPLEALRDGVPVIISKQSGVSEVLHHAVKVDFWDTDAMANAIYGVLNYKALSDFLMKDAEAEISQISWSNAADKINKIYESLIQ